MQNGVADPNPYDGISFGQLNLWTYDHYHASAYGSYLEALVVFGTVTRLDPRSLGVNECAGFELGLSGPQVSALQEIAAAQLLNEELITASAAAAESAATESAAAAQPCH
jgi:hypothetical protein